MTTEMDAPSGEKKKAKGSSRKKRQPKPADVWLNAQLAPHKKWLSRKAWLESAVGVLSIAQAGCLAMAVHALFIEKTGFMGVLPFALALLGVIAIRAGLSFSAGRIGHWVSAAVRHDLRVRLAATLASQSPLDKERRSAGEIAALGSDVIESLDAYAARYLSLKLQLMVIPLAVLLATAYFSWAVAVILLICGPLIPVFMAIVGMRAKKAADAQVSALSDMSSRFLDRLSGMTTLRLFRAVGRTRAVFEGLAGDYRRATMRVLRIAFLSSGALELFSALGIALTAIYVGYHYLGYADYGSYGVPITLSSGLFLLLLAPDFFTPLRDFAAAYHDRATAQAAADRLLLVLPVDEAGADAETPASGIAKSSACKEPVQQIASLSFEQCDLGYDDGRGAILRDVSLAAKTGETIAILGASGAGKSTLLAALCGFLVPSSGRLALNGSDAPQDLAGWEDVRRSIAWIGQRPHIFHGSFLSNVRLAAPDAAREAVGDALSLAHADRFVAQLPRDVLTILGETGFGISGGQVRRLAIARAALNPASLILCDEPTADLDADTAALVTDSLMDLAKDRILIVATHDRAVAERCDRVFYVRDGKVELIDAAELTQIDEAALLADEGADASPNDGPEASGKEVRS